MKAKANLALIGIILSAAPGHAATLDVDSSRSRIHVDAHATGHDFTGTLKKYTARVSGDTASMKPEGFELGWSFKDLETGDADRDKQMLKWLGGGDPKGSFRFTKSWTDKDGKTHGMGTLKIHGVPQEVSFPYSVKKDRDWVTIDGTVSLDYENFKLPVIRTMAVMTVDPRLKVRFHVVGKVN
ncbi:YceI family protein [Akkermansiaceae bacterium]|nr:YceI family protein [Akkermansiaceae bacterium]